MRLIDADALADKVADLYTEGENATEADKVVNDVIDLIDNAPTVDIKPFASVTFDKDELEQIVRDKVIEPIKNGELVVKEERPQGEWIPVSERLPDNETEVLFQYEYGQLMRVGYHIHDSTIYPFGYEDENETGWYDSEDNFICGSDEVIAWMPLPEPYKEAENE